MESESSTTKGGPLFWFVCAVCVAVMISGYGIPTLNALGLMHAGPTWAMYSAEYHVCIAKIESADPADREQIHHLLLRQRSQDGRDLNNTPHVYGKAAFDEILADVCASYKRPVRYSLKCPFEQEGWRVIYDDAGTDCL